MDNTINKFNPADVNTKDEKGYTPLHTASHEGHADLVRLLLEAGAYVNGTCVYYFGETPLHLACKNGHADIARLLIENGAEVSGHGRNGDSPLHILCKNGHADIARLLIENGARVNKWNSHNRTPLHLACKNGHADIARVLIKARAWVDSRDVDGWTPLEVALYLPPDHPEREEILDLFPKKKKMELLHRACKRDEADIVHLLLEHGIDVNTKGPYSRTPIYWARRLQRAHAARVLLEHGAEGNGVNPLLWILHRFPPDSPAREEIIDWYREHHPEMVMEVYCTQQGDAL